MSDFHTWNELQEDTTGRSAYTNAAPNPMRHGKPGVDANGVSRLDAVVWYVNPLARIDDKVC
jgi:hypothetical protein